MTQLRVIRKMKRSARVLKHLGGPVQNRTSTKGSIMASFQTTPPPCVCKHCGKEFTGHKRRFCSPRCRKKSQNQKVRKYPDAQSDRECVVCGKTFTPNALHPKSAVCSIECSKRNYQRGDRAKEKTAALRADASWRAKRLDYRRQYDERTGPIDRLIRLLLTPPPMPKLIVIRNCKCGQPVKRQNGKSCADCLVRRCKMCYRPCDGFSRFCEFHKRERKLANSRISAANWKAANPERTNAQRMKRRLQADANQELYNRIAIFERDKFVCHICKRPTDKTKRHPHPDAPVIDHVIPLAKGGADAEYNVACAHSFCNSSKNDAVISLF